MRAAATATAATTTATTATGVGDFFFSRHATQFEGQADVFADLFLQAFERLLGRHEIARDLVVEQRVAGGLEFLDLLVAQLDTGVLLVMQLLAALMNALVLKAGSIIVEEKLNLFLKHDEGRIAGDLGTELAGFFDDR